MTRIRPVSLKRAKQNRLRKVVTDSLKGQPCARCGGRADDAHELLSRARGGSITDPGNIVPLCRDCHSHVHLNPAASSAAGYMVSAFGGKP